LRSSKRANGNGDGFVPQSSIRCAIYTRKSTDEGLDSDFNTLDAQRECAEAFIVSQRTKAG
jgi:site-specific DNA recombinase